MKKPLFAILILTLLCCTNTVEKDTDFSIFDAMRSGYQNMEFISSSQSETINTDQWLSLEIEIISQGLAKTDENNIVVANNYITSKPNSNYYKSSTNKEFILIEKFDDESTLNDRWTDVQGAIEVYSGIQNADKGFYYLKLEESKLISLNATFRNSKYIFNLKQELSSSNTDPDTWQQAEIDEYLDNIKKLNDNIDLIAKYLISEDEKVYRPLNGRQLTSDERLFGFIKFWTEVKYNFAFFDQVPHLNWDAVLLDYLPQVQSVENNTDYYKLLSKVCALLNDGHTNIYLPSELYQNIGEAPIELKEFESGIYLTNFDKNLESRLEIGLKLTSIENMEVDEYIKQNILPYVSASTDYIKRQKAISKMLEGETGTSLHLQFSNQGQSVIELDIERSQNNVNWIREEPDFHLVNFNRQDNIGVLELNSFGSRKIVERFESYLDSLTLIDKLVIDLRNNGGGNSSYGYQILDYFSSQPIITSKWKTREHKAAFKAWGQSINSNLDELDDWGKEAKQTFEEDYWYESPADTLESINDLLKDLSVVILIGNNTASAAEDFLIAAESISLGKTIGNYTYGSTGQPMFIRLPGGGSARICTKRDMYSNGKEFVGYGIKPDFIVRGTVQDFVLGHDEVLNRAIQILED